MHVVHSSSASQSGVDAAHPRSDARPPANLEFHVQSHNVSSGHVLQSYLPPSSASSSSAHADTVEHASVAYSLPLTPEQTPTVRSSDVVDEESKSKSRVGARLEASDPAESKAAAASEIEAMIKEDSGT
jgi:hypothetical protein